MTFSQWLSNLWIFNPQYIQYSGNHVNQLDFENQILTKGDINDKLSLFEGKTDELKYTDSTYLGILNLALTDDNASYSFGIANIFRKIGEFYEAKGDIQKTIENWDKAYQLNPKIGVKRKLDKLKNKV